MRLIAFAERGTLVTGTRADEVSGLGLFDGVRGPADAAAEREKPERRVRRQPEGAGERYQRKVDVGPPAGRREHRLLKTLHGLVGIDRRKQGRGARVTVRVKRMAEAGQRAVVREPAFDRPLGTQPRGIVQKQHDAVRRTAVAWTGKRRKP